MSNLPVNMTKELKGELETMSKEIGISQNALTVIALHSLVKVYELKGRSMFKELWLEDNN